MIGFMSTSLNVVNIAVSFLTVTKRLAMVLRNDDIRSRRSFLAPGFLASETTEGSALAAAATAGVATFGVSDAF